MTYTYQVMPDLSREDFGALKADIAERGVLVPVEYDEDGNILDGHHRIRACNELGIVEWPRLIRKGLSETEKLTHARRLNLARRHLNRQQRRELIEADLKTDPTRSNRQVAEGLGVSPTTVITVRGKLEDAGVVSKLDTVTGKDGIAQPARKPIRTAYIDPSPSGKKEALDSAKSIRAEKAAIRRLERLDALADIALGNEELGTETKYPVIYADPPWRYENPPIGASNRSIENHYPTMSLEEICALPVSDLATEDAMLYLWATAPKLAECFQVIEAWGFEYRTNMIWDKEKIGMGYHARNQHEILLICKRGQLPPPEAGKQPSSVFREARSAHSAKPHFYYDMIERAYPQLPKIELFCRSPREGWAVWGNQSGAAA